MSEYIIDTSTMEIDRRHGLITRCRDCNNLMDNFGYGDGDICRYFCEENGIYLMDIDINGFCYWAEPRDES